MHRGHPPATDALSSLGICHVFVERHPWGGFGLGEFGPTVERAVDGALARAALEARHRLGSARPTPRVTPPPEFSVFPIRLRAMAKG